MTSFKKLGSFFDTKLFKYGLPFLIVVLGGSFGLKEFTQLRYQYSRVSQLTPAEAEKLGVLKKPGKVTLESEYDKIKELDIDSWNQIRGPRPWEEETMQANKPK